MSVPGAKFEVEIVLSIRQWLGNGGGGKQEEARSEQGDAGHGMQVLSVSE